MTSFALDYDGFVCSPRINGNGNGYGGLLSDLLDERLEAFTKYVKPRHDLNPDEDTPYESLARHDQVFEIHRVLTLEDLKAVLDDDTAIVLSSGYDLAALAEKHGVYLDVVEYLEGQLIHPEAYLGLMQARVWSGDKCGCFDDRCIGHHGDHREGEYCDCFKTLADSLPETWTLRF